MSCLAWLKNLGEIRLNDLCLIKSKACILSLYLVAEVTLEDGTLERPSNDVTFKISNLKFQVSIHKYMSSLSDIFKRTPGRYLGRFTLGHYKSYAMTHKLWLHGIRRTSSKSIKNNLIVWLDRCQVKIIYDRSSPAFSELIFSSTARKILKSKFYDIPTIIYRLYIGFTSTILYRLWLNRVYWYTWAYSLYDIEYEIMHWTQLTKNRTKNYK